MRGKAAKGEEGNTERKAISQTSNMAWDLFSWSSTPSHRAWFSRRP